jgi:DNA-binding response OmpR family regulator
MQLRRLEDDLDLGRSISESLRAAGFDVEWVRRD